MLVVLVVLVVLAVLVLVALGGGGGGGSGGSGGGVPAGRGSMYICTYIYTHMSHGYIRLPAAIVYTIVSLSRCHAFNWFPFAPTGTHKCRT